ncbi:restriction endonuclease [Burkholderia cenocepacia]|uniref:restriction endonuclease n=1 Tax=Burkholderia cenocepacia TaxID=95486 RepID=UPI0024B671D2|nr:restriction endonuclease [Burkholderia cenocepacia]MDI9700131.1 restriction endonuclease [Burkholderia cenocepacia]
MPIPGYQSLMLPVLELAADQKEHRFRDVVETLAGKFQLTDEDRNTLLPSGTAPLFDNRVGWARTYLKQAGLVESKKRGFFNITSRGLALLAQHPTKIDNTVLDQFPEFAAFRQKKVDDSPSGQNKILSTKVSPPPVDSTPEELFAQAYQRLRGNLEAELLEQIKDSTPAFFERLVIDLLVAMGYGGSRQDAGSVIGKSGDGGIDGTIKEDKLGLDVIYVQAKKWEGSVGRPEIQKFAGALQGQRANKGVFITTSAFTREAKDYANAITSKIILVDGELLVQLMVDHDVGVSTASSYQIKKIDSDYFDGDAL